MKATGAAVKKPSTKQAGVILVVMIALVPAVVLLGLGIGSMSISPVGVVRALLFEKDTIAHQIIWNIRLP
ncbi:MAG: hypothetical protein GF344_16845, partial [Chitinivibrionales bacterium]|nr:hypothetical protein [Chitinivibrionales bacterium]